MPKPTDRTHDYHSQATILEGKLRLPLIQEIKPQAYAHLQEEGGYKSEHSCGYQLEGIISFSAAHTQVAGNRSTKSDQGWTTITTTVVEKLNVLEVVTADRVVGQIITEHPLDGYVPRINFLGTHFENLRIAGHPVNLKLDLNLFGAKPANDAAYTKDPGFLDRVGGQHKRVRQHQDLPAEVLARYNQLPGTAESSTAAQEIVECSLVNQAEGSFPGPSFGHVIIIPDFGTITLARVTLTHEDFEKGIPKRTTVRLTMVDLKLGCAIDGDVPIGTGSTNGTTHP
jgi:hypothetical protein